MLQTQIGYWQLVETNRHNLVAESQNAIDLGIKQGTLNESIRHNKAQEDIGWFNAQETQRHNVETENISWFHENEQQRHNMEQENIGWYNAYETRRHNVATEAIGRSNVQLGYSQLAETARHNSVAEYQNLIDVNTRQSAQSTNSANVAQRIKESQANIGYTENRSRTETSVRFRNYTSGFESIVSGVSKVSDSVLSWLKSAKAVKGFAK